MKKSTTSTARPKAAASKAATVDLSKTTDPESLAQQKDRLKKMLLAKLKVKYASNDEASYIVEKQVSDFVNRVSKVRPTDLADLEGKIRVLVLASENRDAVAKGSGESKRGDSVCEPSLAPSAGAGNPVPQLDVSKVSTHDLLTLYEELASERKEKEKAEKTMKEKESIKAALDKQLKVTEDKKSKEKNDDYSYAAKLAAEIQKWKEDEVSKSEKAKSKLLDEKRIREAQILANKQRKSDELTARRREEEESLSRARAGLEEEKESARQKKQIQKDQFLVIMEENKKNQLIKEAEKRKEAEHDLKLMKEYKEKLDREEEARRSWYNQTYERQAKLQAANRDQRAEEFQREADLLARIDAHARKKELEDKRKEEEKLAERERKQQETNKMLALQIEMKRKEAEREKEENRKISASIAEKELKVTAEEERKNKARADKAMANRRAIEQQIEEKRNKGDAKPTDAELALNKGILEKIKNDPILYSALATRLKEGEGAEGQASSKPKGTKFF